MKLITVTDLETLVATHGFKKLTQDLVTYLKNDFSDWKSFDKSPRHACHVPDGVIELMPICNHQYYAFKYVNGHPKNPLSGKQTIVATGQLSQVVDGHPLLISEMTVLTAFRTAATTILATDFLARPDSHVLAMIGTGAQSEFQTLAQTLIRDIQEVRFFDTDPLAMDKYQKNLSHRAFKLTRCESAEQACLGADIITVCTACKGHVNVICNDWIQPGVHINGLGGDCPGKTELEKSLLYRSKIVVEFLPQSMIEGEIQRLTPTEVASHVHAELWELITHQKPGRENPDEITLFDSVGFALEDFSALRLTHDLAKIHKIGHDIDMIPPLSDPKDLISAIKNF